LVGLHTPNDPVVNEVRPRAIIFLVVDMTQTAADLVILLLRRRRLLPFVPYLLRPLANHALLLVVALTGDFLALLYAALKRILLALLATLLLPGPLLALLLGSTLFVGSSLSIGVLLCLVLVLIGHLSSPSWLRALQKPT
jgi:hypothetical protein